MLRVVLKEETDRKNNIEWWVRKSIIEACMENGVPFELADDSVVVQTAISNIVNKIYNLRHTLERQGEDTLYTSGIISRVPSFKPINPTKQMKKKLKEEKEFLERVRKLDSKEILKLKKRQ